MRNFWRRLPGVFRWFLVSLTIMVVVGLGAYAYRVLTIEGEATVLEAISADPETFQVTMYPGETVEQTVTVSNKSSAELKVDLEASISPGDQGVYVQIEKSSLKIPGNGSVQVDVIVTAGNDAVPDIYTIRVPVDRNKTED